MKKNLLLILFALLPAIFCNAEDTERVIPADELLFAGSSNSAIKENARAQESLVSDHAPSYPSRVFSPGGSTGTPMITQPGASAISLYVMGCEVSYDTISVIACESYTSPSGAFTWTQSGTYSDTLTNAAECDSIITIELAIPDLTVTETGYSLISNTPGASYRWLNCDEGFIASEGATNIEVAPLINANIAVEVTLGECVDTSECIAFVVPEACFPELETLTGVEIDDINFGWSVSVDSLYAIVGAPFEELDTTREGAAYIYKNIDGSWVFQQKLLPSLTEPGDQFGYSVVVEGERAAVGAPRVFDNSDTIGQVYIFDYDGTSWVQTAVLTGNDTDPGDNFGVCVDLEGDRLITGANKEDQKGSRAGSAYVFEWDGSSWAQTYKILADDGGGGDEFGVALSIAGNRVLIGANKDMTTGPQAGSAYIFDFDGEDWVQQAKLVAAGSAAGDNFGHTVALYGNTEGMPANFALIGAQFDDENGSDAGAVYFFESIETVWTQQQKIVADDIQEGDNFGSDIGVLDGKAVIGAKRSDPFGSSNAGAAYFFRLEGLTWVQECCILPQSQQYGDFGGSAVAISSEFVIVGAPKEDGEGINRGAAYFFDHCGSSIVPSCPPPGNTSATPQSPYVVRLEWDATPGAIYQVRGRVLGTEPFAKTATANSFKLVGGLQPATSYEWQVRMKCEDEEISDYSPLDTFTMPPLEKLARLELDLQVSPNPVYEQLNAQISASEAMSSSLRITNLLGEVIYEEVLFIHAGYQSIPIDAGNLNNGLYILSLRNGSQSETISFNVMR